MSVQLTDQAIENLTNALRGNGSNIESETVVVEVCGAEIEVARRYLDLANHHGICPTCSRVVELPKAEYVDGAICDRCGSEHDIEAYDERR